jgi:YesN/AraC family two-component response regulator
MPQPQRVLCIDDDPHVLEGLRRLVHPLAHAWQFTFTANGHDALTLLACTPFDIVITDLVMPKPDGLEILLELRRRFPAVKVVVMSGGGRWGIFNLLDIAHKLGASRILAKPFRLQALLEALEDVTHAREALALPDGADASTQS